MLGAVVAAGLVLLPSAGTELKAATPKSKRPTIAVMDFDYGTINDRWWGSYDIGKGMADQVVDAKAIEQRRAADGSLAQPLIAVRFEHVPPVCRKTPVLPCL